MGTGQSRTAMDSFMSAVNGVDIFADTDTHTPPSQVTWKGFVVLAETVVNAITDDGGIPSTGLTATLPIGAVITANGNFTSIDLTSGTVLMVRH